MSLDALISPTSPPTEHVAPVALADDGNRSEDAAVRLNSGGSAPDIITKTGDVTKLRVLILNAKVLYTDGSLKTMRPNFGNGVRFTWDTLVTFLSQSKQGNPERYPDADIAKRQWGGWVGGEFKNNRRNIESFVSTQLLIVDVDGNANVERLARLLRGYRVAVHTTYKSTEDDPRARVVFMLSALCTDAARYKAAHAVVRALLASKGFVLDDGASDCARLNYIPMHRPGYTPRFHTHDGKLLDIVEMMQPDAEPEPIRPHRLGASGRSGSAKDESYRRAAMRKAHDTLAAAPSGKRHNTLVREAWSLSRPELDLTIGDIEGALLPAYTHDIEDGKRTIKDEFCARRGRST